MTAFGMIVQEMDGRDLALPKILEKVTARTMSDVRTRAFEAREAPKKVTDFIPVPSPVTEPTAQILKIRVAPNSDTTSPTKATPMPQVSESGFPIAPASTPSATPAAMPNAGTAPGFLDQELIPGIRNLWLIAGAGGLLLLIVLLRGRK